MTSPDNRPGLAASAAQLLVRQAARLPLQAISLGLAVWDRTEPVRSVAQRHGAEALQIVAHTPLGRFLPQADLADGADEEAQRIVAHVRTTVAAELAEPPAEPAPAAVAAGAPGVATPTADAVAEQLHLPPATGHGDLPVPDFDTISLGSLRARLRSLSLIQLVQLREWEQAHAHRLPVLTLLENRIAKLSADAYPADGTAAVDKPASN